MKREPEETLLARAKEQMMEFHLRRRGIRDRRVLSAFGRVPREEFVPAHYRRSAYDDHPLEIGAGQTISQPYIVALMTEALALSGDEEVLEIGTGSGYQTAIIATLARRVCTIERIATLSERARKTLEGLGYRNVEYHVGDGTLGWPVKRTFDRIIVTAGAPKVPEPLTAQLAEGGLLVIPVGNAWGQTLYAVEKRRGKTVKREICGCIFVKLIGEHAWKSGNRKKKKRRKSKKGSNAQGRRDDVQAGGTVESPARQIGRKPMQEEEFWPVVESVAKKVETDKDGSRTIEVAVGEERTQLIRIKVEDLGSKFGPCAVFGTLVGELGDLDCEKALRLNASAVRFGAIAVMEEAVVLRETLRLATCDREEILFTISELATVGDRLEKELYGSDRF